MLLGLRAMVGVNVCNPDPRGKLDSAVHRLTETRVHAGVALKESEFGSDQVAEWYADPKNSSTRLCLPARPDAVSFPENRRVRGDLAFFWFFPWQ
jgi:hypothetical protein